MRMTRGETRIPNNQATLSRLCLVGNVDGGLLACTLIKGSIPCLEQCINCKNMFNWEVFLRVFAMLAVSIFVISSIVVALAIIGALIHPFMAIILPIIGIIAMIAIVAACERP